MPDQILVIGEGIEPESSPWAGAAHYNSPFSGDSYDNGIAAAGLVHDHRNIAQVVFSGRHGITLPDHEVPDSTEAEAMELIAVTAGIDIGRELEPHSTTPVGHFLHSLKWGFIKPDRPLGVVMHRHNQVQTMRAGRLVLPGTTLVPIVSDSQERTALGIRRRMPSKVPGMILEAAMSDVRPGDVETIAYREELALKVMSPALALNGLLWRMTGPLYQTYHKADEN